MAIEENRSLQNVNVNAEVLFDYFINKIYDKKWHEQERTWTIPNTYSKEEWEIEIEKREDLWHAHLNRIRPKFNQWLKNRFLDMMYYLCDVDLEQRKYIDESVCVHFLLSIEQIEEYPISRKAGCMNIRFRQKGAWGRPHPIPPSVNKMYVSRSNKIVRSKVYNDWLRDNVGNFEVWYDNYKTGWAEPVGVDILANLPRNRDLDNIIKPIVDAFVMAKIIPDDNFVDFVLARRSKEPPEGYFHINISDPFENDKYWHE